ncbi:MAG: ribosome recycling factor [Minisyncoccia bacterium]
MVIDEFYNKTKEKFENILSEFKNFLLQARSNTVPIALIENIKVDYFGQNLPIKQLGIIGVLNSREIEISLWDESYVHSVVKAIEQRNLGFGLKIEKNKIYLSFPKLDEETKKAIVKNIIERKEKHYQEMRKVRDEIIKEVQQQEIEGKIKEDEKFKIKEKIDKLFREYDEKFEELKERKEKELEQ